jgi:hypothetical protein
VTLRCTRKALELLGARAGALPNLPQSDDDWYLNLLWIDRRKCVLLVHAGTLFPVFVADVHAADLRPVGPYIVEAIATELAFEGLPPGSLGQLDPNAVHVAKTASRRASDFLCRRFTRVAGRRSGS